MGERVDLDAVQAHRDEAQPAHHRHAIVPETLLDDVDTMTVELRELRGRYGKDGEIWCGARRDQAGSAYCVEMAGHERYGVGHMWSGATP